MAQPRIIFAGTPEFALTSLQALVESGNTPVAVLTQPDRPAGRGRQMTASPVKQFADAAGIAVLQPETLRDDSVISELARLEPDMLIVAAYGLILPQAVLDIPSAGCLNVHASLLPRWRGAAPIQAAIKAGDAQTGVCLMAMTAGLDCGPVYVSESMTVGADETAGELHDRIAAAGGRLLIRHLADIIAGNISPQEQDESAATYAPKIRASDAVIDWQRSATELDRIVRAFNPTPGAYFLLDDERIKCSGASIAAGADATPGTVIDAGPEGITVACGDGALCMTSLQRPGKRLVSAGEFAAQLDILGRHL
jgi:methionyl-tRNA formyltransferase